MAGNAFPADFTWGVSTAAYQIEGYPLEDGASPSIWHQFAHQEGNIRNNESGDIACDHYHRYPHDIEHMRELGVHSYRFSVSWPRIVPEPGTINQKGLDFYSKLVDTLLENNIEPLLTIFHWDAPVWLFEQGGFLSRSSVDHIRFYSEALFEHLGDRVKKWVTINEPMVFAVSGYITGEMPPGKKNDIRGFLHTSHMLLLSHAEIVQRFRDLVPDGKIGIAEAQVWMKPFRKDHRRDKQAARFMDQVINRSFIDPIVHGTYPADVTAKFSRFFPEGFEQDLPSMHGSFDFIGLNYYTSRSYKYSLFTIFSHAKEKYTPGYGRSAMWEIFPQGLYFLLKRLQQEYGNPECYITENGYPLPEGEEPILEDGERIEYLRDHINMAHRAVSQGVNLKGYYHWSLMDNFEWAHGYYMRFGLIRIDFSTLERQWKKSAHWYRDVIQRGGTEEESSQ